MVRCRVITLVLLLPSVMALACRRSPEPTVAAASSAAMPMASSMTDSGTAPHGDHQPHHGGIVYMYADLHYEVVLESDGHHRVYFTDSVREDLPASVASEVSLTIEAPRHQREKLIGTIDPQGECWIFGGQPVAGGDDTVVRVAFVAKGDQYWIDVPFIASAR
jgi:hypothetical protein